MGKTTDLTGRQFGLLKVIESNKPTVKSKSGVQGVYFNNSSRKWRAAIGFRKKQIFLGEYDQLEDAVKARRRAEEEIYQPFLERYYEELDA